jgi:hypothetical protein
MKINLNKKIIAIISVIFLVGVGYLGKNNNEENETIKKSEKYIENREYEYARDTLSRYVEGNNKKIDKLWNVVYCFQGAGTELYANKNIDKAKAYLDKMDSSYTKYSALKKDVEKIKSDIKEREDYIVEVDNLIKEVESLITNKDYEVYKKAQKMVDTNNFKFYWELLSRQRDKVTELDAKINNELFELRKVEDKKQLEAEENELKSQDEKFTVEMAKEFAEKDRSINTGNTKYEVKSDAQYDKEGRQYYKVEVYLKDNNQLINNYAIYASGAYELLQTVEGDNLGSAKADDFRE